LAGKSAKCRIGRSWICSTKWSILLRCFIEDGGPDGEITICIDNQELSLGKFGRLLLTHAGWGMRIAFVPVELVDEEPEVKVCESTDGDW